MINVIINLALQHFMDSMEPIMPVVCYDKDCEEIPVSLKTKMMGISVYDDYWVMMDDDGVYSLYKEIYCQHYYEEDIILKKLKGLCISGVITEIPEILPEEIVLTPLKKVNKLTAKECKKILDSLSSGLKASIDYHEEQQAYFRKTYDFINTIKNYV